MVARNPRAASAILPRDDDDVAVAVEAVRTKHRMVLHTEGAAGTIKVIGAISTGEIRDQRAVTARRGNGAAVGAAGVGAATGAVQSPAAMTHATTTRRATEAGKEVGIGVIEFYASFSAFMTP